MGSGGFTIWVSSTSLQKSSIGWPQQPPTEKMLNSIWYFMILPRKTFFQNIKIKLNSNAWITLRSPVVIFQPLKPLQPQWPQWPQQPRWPQWPQQPHCIKKITDPDGLIISSTQMTNTSPFLWNGSSKIQFFTDIWYFFCQRLLRPAKVIFVENWWGRQNLAFLRNT